MGAICRMTGPLLLRLFFLWCHLLPLPYDKFEKVYTDLSAEEYPLVTWRLLNTVSADGATNMAIDEAILTALPEGRSLPTLRFLAW